MSVNIKENGVVTKLSGLYNNMVGKIKDLADVQVSSPTNGQILQYDGTASKWKNQNMPASGHTYSTEKRAVGTWIDGRTIYEATLTAPVSQTGSVNSLHDLNADIYIDIQACYYIDYTYYINTDPSATYTKKETWMCDFANNSFLNNEYKSNCIYTASQNRYVSFWITYYPASDTMKTITNVNKAEIYYTIQFVEPETQEGE